MRRSRVNLGSSDQNLGGSGEDWLTPWSVTDYRDLLIILVMAMGIMVLLPQGLASLHRLQILPAGSEVVNLPTCDRRRELPVVFASEGGNELIDFRLAGGDRSKGLDWIKVRHDDILTASMPGYETTVGLGGKPDCAPDVYEFTLTAHSTTNDKDDPELKKPKFVTSPPRKFRLRVVLPPPPQIFVEDLAILTPERIAGPDWPGRPGLGATDGPRRTRPADLDR